MSPKEMKYGQKVANKMFFLKVLDELELNKKYMGYYLLVEIEEIMIEKQERVKSFSTQIYPQIAQKYGKTPCTIERNIRSLIDKCWNNNLMIKLNTYFIEGEKPSCKEFIYLVKNYILKQIL